MLCCVMCVSSGLFPVKRDNVLGHPHIIFLAKLVGYLSCLGSLRKKVMHRRGRRKESGRTVNTNCQNWIHFFNLHHQVLAILLKLATLMCNRRLMLACYLLVPKQSKMHQPNQRFPCCSLKSGAQW